MCGLSRLEHQTPAGPSMLARASAGSKRPEGAVWRRACPSLRPRSFFWGSASDRAKRRGESSGAAKQRRVVAIRVVWCCVVSCGVVWCRVVSCRVVPLLSSDWRRLLPAGVGLAAGRRIAQDARRRSSVLRGDAVRAERVFKKQCFRRLSFLFLVRFRFGFRFRFRLRFPFPLLLPVLGLLRPRTPTPSWGDPGYKYSTLLCSGPGPHTIAALRDR